MNSPIIVSLDLEPKEALYNRSMIQLCEDLLPETTNLTISKEHIDR